MRTSSTLLPILALLVVAACARPTLKPHHGATTTAAGSTGDAGTTTSAATTSAATTVAPGPTHEPGTTTPAATHKHHQHHSTAPTGSPEPSRTTVSPANVTSPEPRRAVSVAAFAALVAASALTYFAVLNMSGRAVMGGPLFPGAGACPSFGVGGMGGRRYSNLSFDDEIEGDNEELVGTNS